MLVDCVKISSNNLSGEANCTPIYALKCVLLSWYVDELYTDMHAPVGPCAPPTETSRPSFSKLFSESVILRSNDNAILTYIWRFAQFFDKGALRTLR